MEFKPIKNFLAKKGQICLLEISQADDGINCYACYLDDEKQIVQAISDEMKNMADDMDETYETELDFRIISTTPLSKETMKQLEKTFPSES